MFILSPFTKISCSERIPLQASIECVSDPRQSVALTAGICISIPISPNKPA
ncbi:hypothetical protein Hanom_Chr11g01020711 [Helianthus anomalus]